MKKKKRFFHKSLKMSHSSGNKGFMWKFSQDDLSCVFQFHMTNSFKFAGP